MSEPNSSSPTGSSSTAMKYHKTFRIRGVPLDWSREQLVSFLSLWDASAGPVVKSLAKEIRGNVATATVTFRDIPLQLRSIRSDGSFSIPLPSHAESSSTSHSLNLDASFHGITTLYAPATNHHKVECVFSYFLVLCLSANFLSIIAVCGLGGHAFGSFKEKDGNHMWLRDSLPRDMTLEKNSYPMARVMTYGYGSSVARSESMQNLEDIAISLYNTLLPLANGPACKPIIFIGHSLGGLVIKQVCLGSPSAILLLTLSFSV